uniref:Uncharacterized protein n=1 Tax=Arundo donax TaxID=35708 RepID=A0A0A9AGY6_ARUDO
MAESSFHVVPLSSPSTVGMTRMKDEEASPTTNLCSSAMRPRPPSASSPWASSPTRPTVGAGCGGIAVEDGRGAGKEPSMCS